MEWKYRETQYGPGSDRLRAGRLTGTVRFLASKPRGSKETYGFWLSFKEENWEFETQEQAKEFGEQMMEVAIATMQTRWLQLKGKAPTKRK